MTYAFLAQIRGDRTGAQFYDMVSKYLYSMHHNKKLLVCRSKQYGIGFREEIFFRPFLGQLIFVKHPEWKNFFNNSASDYFEDPGGEIPEIEGVEELKQHGVRGAAAILVSQVGLDLLTYSKTKLDFNLNAFSHISPDFKTGQIVIHVRNGDVSNEPVHDGFMVHKYCKELIESKKYLQNYNRKSMDALASDTQCPTSERALDKILSDVCSRYPDKEVHLVSEDKYFSSRRYENISKKYNIKFFSNDIITDFYHLATSDVLIGSRSSYCAMGLYYFTGKEFFYPHWSLYTCLGLGTKYDKTNYKSFRNI